MTVILARKKKQTEQKIDPIFFLVFLHTVEKELIVLKI